MLNIRMPPNITPSGFNLQTRSFVHEPIPGMVRLPLGIPLVHHINGDPKRAVTAVCAHSLDTLMEYEEGPEIHALVPRLMELAWGKDAEGNIPAVPGIFELDGMRTNLRSKHVDLTKLAKGDGSYNLASTHGEGEGHGHFAPAVQTNTPEAASIIKEVLQILHRLYRLIMPLCISRFEWEMMEFAGYENNVIAFGGIEPGPTGCQLNVSSAANIVDIELPEDDDEMPDLLYPDNDVDSDPIPELKTILLNLLKAAGLDTSIGTQGAPHGDLKDDILWNTLFVLLFRLPPGSDPGAFFWMRGAIYIRELVRWKDFDESYDSWLDADQLRYV